MKILDMTTRPNQPDGLLACKEKILVGISLAINITVANYPTFFN